MQLVKISGNSVTEVPDVWKDVDATTFFTSALVFAQWGRHTLVKGFCHTPGCNQFHHMRMVKGGKLPGHVPSPCGRGDALRSSFSVAMVAVTRDHFCIRHREIPWSTFIDNTASLHVAPWLWGCNRLANLA